MAEVIEEVLEAMAEKMIKVAATNTKKMKNVAEITEEDIRDLGKTTAEKIRKLAKTTANDIERLTETMAEEIKALADATAKENKKLANTTAKEIKDLADSTAENIEDVAETAAAKAKRMAKTRANRLVSDRKFITVEESMNVNPVFVEPEQLSGQRTGPPNDSDSSTGESGTETETEDGEQGSAVKDPNLVPVEVSPVKSKSENSVLVESLLKKSENSVSSAQELNSAESSCVNLKDSVAATDTEMEKLKELVSMHLSQIQRVQDEEIEFSVEKESIEELPKTLTEREIALQSESFDTETSAVDVPVDLSPNDSSLVKAEKLPEKPRGEGADNNVTTAESSRALSTEEAHVEDLTNSSTQFPPATIHEKPEFSPKPGNSNIKVAAEKNLLKSEDSRDPIAISDETIAEKPNLVTEEASPVKSMSENKQKNRRRGRMSLKE